MRTENQYVHSKYPTLALNLAPGKLVRFPSPGLLFLYVLANQIYAIYWNALQN